MQLRSMFLVFALLVPAVASLSAASEARSFLQRFAGSPPQQDQLAELNRENPEAYALVKALLTKRSLGLLDPRHPDASFARPSAEQQKQRDEADQGAEVFTNMLKPGELEAVRAHQESSVAEAPKVALPYAAVAPHHQDMFNWKPNQADNDDQMVQNVLGAVAELKGGKNLRAPQQESGSSLSADESSLGVESAPAAPKPVVAAPAPRENSYLKTIDFGIRTPEKPAESKENSYLKGLDLTGDMPQAVGQKRTAQVQAESSDSLASFSWDDSKPAEQPKPKVVAQPEVEANSKDHSLLSWLGVVKKAPPAQAAPAAPAKPVNAYIMDLN